MGEAKRRKTLDPNYGKTFSLDRKKQRFENLKSIGSNHFTGEALSKYSEFCCGMINRVQYTSLTDFVDSILAVSTTRWDYALLLNLLKSFLPNLPIGVRDLIDLHFGLFVVYIITTDDGFVLIEKAEEQVKGKITEKDLFVLFGSLITATSDYNHLCINYQA